MSLIYTFIQHLCWRCVGVFVLDHFVSWQAFLITVCLYLLLTYPSLTSVSFSDAASTINMVHSWHYKSTKICGFFTICSLFLWYILTLYSEMETHTSCHDLLNLFISAKCFARHIRFQQTNPVIYTPIWDGQQVAIIFFKSVFTGNGGRAEAVNESCV